MNFTLHTFPGCPQNPNYFSKNAKIMFTFFIAWTFAWMAVNLQGPDHEQDKW